MSFKINYIDPIEELEYVNIKDVIEQWKSSKIKEYNESIKKTHADQEKIRQEQGQYRIKMESHGESLQAIFAEINSAIHLKKIYPYIFEENAEEILLRKIVERVSGREVTDIDILVNGNLACENISAQKKEDTLDLQSIKTKGGKTKWYYLYNGETNIALGDAETKELRKIKSIILAIPDNYELNPKDRDLKHKMCELKKDIGKETTKLKNEGIGLYLVKMPYGWDGKKMFPCGENEVTIDTVDKIYNLFIENNPDSVDLNDILPILYTEKEQKALFE